MGQGCIKPNCKDIFIKKNTIKLDEDLIDISPKNSNNNLNINNNDNINNNITQNPNPNSQILICRTKSFKEINYNIKYTPARRNDNNQ
jgi:hypothetical protein